MDRWVMPIALVVSLGSLLTSVVSAILGDNLIAFVFAVVSGGIATVGLWYREGQIWKEGNNGH